VSSMIISTYCDLKCSIYLKTKQKTKGCKGRIYENGGPVFDSGGSLFRIGNIIFTKYNI
jgi:hypothetical protein